MTPKHFFLHTSNQTEALAACLLDVMDKNSGASPLTAATVMVQNSGTARWLSFQIAQAQGVTFNINFPFPAKIFSKIATAFAPDFETHGQFDETHAKWSLYQILSELPETPDFHLIHDYCATPQKRSQLASKLATLYDQYLIYRPDTIIQWEDRDSDHWQGLLWKLLLKKIYPTRVNPPHIARIWHKLKSSPQSLKLDNRDLPPSLHIFGISTLAPLYLDLLNATSHQIPIHLFLLQPTDQYWGDLKTRAQINRTTNQSSQFEFALEPDDFETGNPLLPLLGKQGQAFLDSLLDIDPQHDDSHFQFPSQANPTLLQCIQNDILSLENRSTPHSNTHLPRPDSSLSIHNCHNIRRECEVLKDFILHQIQADPTLKLSDFIIMAPDIQTYASTIDAVFSDHETPTQRLTFSIADQSPQDISPVTNAFLTSIKLPLNRITAEEIVDLIDLPSIAEKFEFSERDRITIKSWIQTFSISWGWNAQFRSKRDAYTSDRSTWSEFRRILATGIALPADSNEQHPLYRGELSNTDLEGDYALLAGRFLEFLQNIEEVIEASTRTHTLEEWQSVFNQFLNLFTLETDENRSQTQSLRESINQSLNVPNTLLEDTIPYDIAYDAITEAINRQTPRSGYLNGSLTFCSLKPMRSIPAKIIALIGLNLDTFPRKGRQISFDITKSTPRRGDRNPREEDKQIFLEAILSAREKLYISYKGQLDTSDENTPPSTILSSLIDYIDDSYNNPNTNNENISIVTTHKRQRFDPAYFNTKELYSYSPEAAIAASAFQNKRYKTLTPQLDLSHTFEPEETTELSSIIYFFQSPTESYLNERCGIRFSREEEKLVNREAFESTPLDQYKRNNHLLTQLDSYSKTKTKEYFAAQKWTAPGYFGDIETLHSQEAMNSLLQAIAPYQSDIKQPEFPINLPLDIGTHIQGTIPTNSKGWILNAMPGEIKPKRLIEAWIQNIIASISMKTLSLLYNGTILAGYDKKKNSCTLIKLCPVEEPAANDLLKSLINCYIDGHQTPSLLYPDLGHDYAVASLKALKKDEPFKEQNERAKIERKYLRPSTFKTEYTRPALSEQPAIQLCFGDTPSLDPRFSKNALELWLPIIEHSETIRSQYPEK